MDNTQNTGQSAESLKALGKSFKELSEIVDEYSESLGEALNTMGNMVGTISTLHECMNTLGEGFSEVLHSIGNSKLIKSFEENVTEAVKGVSSSMAGLKKDGENTEGIFSSLGTSIKKKFQNMGKDIRSAFDNIPTDFDSLGSLLSTSAETIGASAGSLLSAGMIGGITLAAAAIAGLIVSFQHLMNSNQEFREKIEEAWSAVTEAFEPAIEAFGRFKEALFGGGEDGEDGEMPPFVQMILDGATAVIDCIAEAAALISEIITGVLNELTELWQEHGDAVAELVTGAIENITDIISGIIDIVSGIIDVIVGFFTGDGDRISAGVKEMWQGVTKIFDAAWNAIKKTFSVVVDFFRDIWSGISEAFAGVGSFFKEKFTAGYNAVKKAFSGVTSFFSGIWTSIRKMFTSIGTTIGNAIGGAFKNVVNSIIGFAQSTINGFISAINSAIKMINKIPGVSIGLISTLSIPRLAAGGLVDAGQMFVAREAGPELVGSFGAKTAVMNNDQIVASVSRGVFEAVKAAMGGDGSYTFNIVNKLDGREIGRQVIDYHNGVVKQTGVSPLMI